MAISTRQIKIRKNFFWKSINHSIVSHVLSFQVSATSSSFFRAFFLHFYGATFNESPHINHHQLWCSLFSFLPFLPVCCYFIPQDFYFSKTPPLPIVRFWSFLVTFHCLFWQQLKSSNYRRNLLVPWHPLLWGYIIISVHVHRKIENFYNRIRTLVSIALIPLVLYDFVTGY